MSALELIHSIGLGIHKDENPELWTYLNNLLKLYLEQ